MKEMLKKVCALAIKVGKYQSEQRKTFSRDRVETKHSHDYVSYVDKQSEMMIVSALKALSPKAGFITEEKTTEQTDGTEYEWIVDPLDGTTNFIHDLGPWCVCIALKHNGELVLGVVYEVSRGELFYATKGEGAWLRTKDNELKRLQVSPVSDVDGSLVCIGYPYDAEAYRDFCVSLTSRLYGRCVSVRSFGSAETELCYVAAGRIEMYIESYIKPWDVSAGAVILKEAGGRITDYQGEDRLWPSGREVMATNGRIHTAMLEEIRRCRL